MIRHDAQGEDWPDETVAVIKAARQSARECTETYERIMGLLAEGVGHQTTFSYSVATIRAQRELPPAAADEKCPVSAPQRSLILPMLWALVI